MQTLPLYTIFSAWKDALASDADIANWCMTKYNKQQTVFAGLDLRNPPNDNQHPYIILRAGAKVESDDEPYRFTYSIAWYIYNDQRTENGNIIEYPGTREIDELGQLILTCLSNVSPNYPITRVDYDIDSISSFPQHVGGMLLELEIDPAIGGSLTYP